MLWREQRSSPRPDQAAALLVSCARHHALHRLLRVPCCAPLQAQLLPARPPHAQLAASRAHPLAQSSLTPNEQPQPRALQQLFVAPLRALRKSLPSRRRIPAQAPLLLPPPPRALLAASHACPPTLHSLQLNEPLQPRAFHHFVVAQHRTLHGLPPSLRSAPP